MYVSYQIMEEIVESPSSSRETLDSVRRERDEKRKEKKSHKKYKKKNKKRLNREIQTLTTTLDRVFERMQRVDDMSLRCYLLLDKISLVMDVGIGALTFANDIPREAREELEHQRININEEISVLMDWLIRNQEITAPVTEMANPLSQPHLQTEDAYQ